MNRLSLSLFAVAGIVLGLAVQSPAADGVYRDHVQPHWLPGHQQFWYRNALPGGASEFIFVDAETGVRKRAFDSAQIAAEMMRISGHRVAPERLPIDALDYQSEPGAILLRGRGKSWRLDAKSGQLSLAKGVGSNDSLPSLPEIGTSREGGAETTIAFENHTGADIRMIWIERDGQRRPYGTIKAGDRREQSTYVGHVWLITDAANRPLGIFQATADPATAILDQNSRPAPIGEKTGIPKAKSRSARIGSSGKEYRGLNSLDGKWAAEVKEENLFIVARDGGEEIQISHDGKPGDGYGADSIRWSPDSRRIAALRIEAGQEHPIYTVESSPEDQVQPRLRKLNYLKPGDRIDHPRPALFDIPARRRIAVNDELFSNPWSIEDLRWSADSSRFTFVYNQRGHQALRVISIDAETGAARAIIDERSNTFIDYSGKFFSHWIGDDEIIWMSERDGWNHLWLYDARAGTVKNLITRGDWPVQEVIHVDEANRQVWFKAGGVRPGMDPYYSQFCRVNFDGSGLTILTDGDGQHSVQWAPGDAYFIDTWSRVDLAPITELRRSDTGALVCRLEEADASEALAARGGRWPEPFVAKGRDGATDIYGIVLFPHDFDAAKKYPVVENIYAGPHGFFTPKAFRVHDGSMQQIADLGAIVVQCDGMGTSGRSKKFHDVCWKNLRDAGFPDRIAWIRSAAGKFPQMDLSRVGIYGGSAGGQSAMAALLWHNDFYRVAVADCGCHDNRMDKIWWNEQWMGWPIDQSYADNSNVVNASLLKGKLMLIVGEMDDNVDPSTTMQVVNALEKADKDFDLVIVTGAHHGAAETPYGSRRRAEFLARNLLGSKD